jgi:hypothetical protein
VKFAFKHLFEVSCEWKTYSFPDQKAGACADGAALSRQAGGGGGELRLTLAA